MNLDPAKLLVILVIALVVLGPERLPQVARQFGALVNEFNRTRSRLAEQLREQIPDLPEPGSVRSFLFDSVARDAGAPGGPDRRPEPLAPGQARLVPYGEADAGPGDPSMN